MMNLMIVDDEERARNGIRTLIDWDSHHIRIVAEARDGAEALELLEHTPVDILLTDIRMPEIDGLELIEQVSRLYPDIKCVIMSGYDEFAYAQKAMAIGACHYLLKPSRRQEILELVVALTEEIEKERRKSRKLEQLKEGFHQSFPLLKENTLNRLVLSENPPYARLLANLKMNDMTLPHRFFGIMVIRMDNFHSFQKRISSEDIELYKYGLKNISEEIMSPLGQCAAFERNDELILLLNTEEWLSRESLASCAESIQQNAGSYLKFTVSVGIGSMGTEVSHLRLSYQEAVRALNAAFYIGEEKIVDYMEAVEGESEHTSYPLGVEKTVLQAVIHGEEPAIRERLSAFLQALHPENASKDHVLNSIFSLFFALYRLCIEKNVNVQEVFGQNLTSITHMLERSSMDSIMSALTDTALAVGQQLNSRKNGNKLFEAVLSYIQQNSHKDISRETVAREVYITPGYVSLLFKQQMQTSFLDYLHRIRIDRACQLFKDRGLRIADVAHDVGYQDEKYFFQVFKKYTGMTPNQYRNQPPDLS
ncbi:response regulator [Cohnella boryungensis]|uniref:Response regulator n=1 Tax=Cohnella boryungensis TaxID=768479 RepID=A0ABV8S8V4_9BACL